MISPIKRRRRRNRNYLVTPLTNSVAGFTLLELIFVVLILVLIATLAIPQFRKSFNYLGLQNFVSDVVSYARYAQAKAIMDGRTKRLFFDIENKRLRLEGTPDDKIWQIEKSKSMPDFISIDLRDSEDGIKFYPDGTTDKSSIKIGIPSGKSYTITMEPMTGYVKVEEPTQ